MPAKSAICDISIPNIVIVEGKHQYKFQEVNNYPKEMCTNKNINLTDYCKNI